MNSFIGKFIVEKNYASQADVLDALNDELQQQPTTIGVLREMSLIDDTQLIEILSESSASQKSVLQVIREKDLLTQDQLSSVIDKKIHGGPSLLQVLVNKGSMTVDKAASIASEYSSYIKSSQESSEKIEEFKGNLEESSNEQTDSSAEASDDDSEISIVALESLKELGIATEEQLAMLEKNAKEVELVEDPNDAPEQPVSAPAESGDSDEDPEVSIVALESLKELGIATDEQLAMLEEKAKEVELVEDGEAGREPAVVEESTVATDVSHSPLVTEYLNQFDDFSYDELLHISKQLVNGLDKSKISEAHTHLSGFLGAAKLAGLNYSVKMFHAWVKLFENILDDKVDFTNINFLKVSGTLKKSVKIAKEFRDTLEKGGEETDVLKDSTLKKNYLDTMKTLLEFLGIKN